eukprot:181178-Prymnesium_polylepis.1
MRPSSPRQQSSANAARTAPKSSTPRGSQRPSIVGKPRTSRAPSNEDATAEQDQDHESSGKLSCEWRSKEDALSMSFTTTAVSPEPGDPIATSVLDACKAKGSRDTSPVSPTRRASANRTSRKVSAALRRSPTVDMLITTLQGMVLFADAEPAVLSTIAQAAVPEKRDAGDVVISQGGK